MRVFAIVLFLMLIVAPAPLFAQQSGGGSTSTSGSASSGTSDTVTNVSAEGGFIGSGKPAAFIGVDQIFDANSARSTTSSAARRQTTTTTRRATRTTTTAQRRTATAGGAAQLGSSTQTIQSVSALDLDIAGPALQRPPQMTVEANLTRIRGIQNGQITFADSPTGTTAILTGTVATEGERRVAKQLLLLEPGINQVENLLEIR